MKKITNIYKFIIEYFKRCKIPTKQVIKEYYPIYLKSHRHPINKAFHFCGNMFILGQILTYFYLGIFKTPLFFIPLPFVMWFEIYIFAWFGHFVFEKNKPATFKANPLLTKICDWKMNYDLLRGKLKWDTRTLFREELMDLSQKPLEHFGEKVGQIEVKEKNK